MRRLFIVEDEAIIAMDLAEQLEEFGFDVVGVAYDGESALAQLKDLDPDLILMDIVLGSGADGVETAERILQTRSIPIIFLTAFSDPDTVMRAAKTAPYGYLTKPYNAQALRASIEIALTKHQLEHKLFYKERWFSNILHAVHDGIVAIGIDGMIHFANSEACRLLEISGFDEISERSITEAIPLYDANGDLVIDSPVAAAMQRNMVLPIVFGGSIKNSHTGNRIFVDYTAAPVRGPSNTVIGGVLAMRDASQRLNIETAIRNSDGRFQAAFKNSSVGIALVSFNNDLIEYNPAFGKLFNIPDSSGVNLLEGVISSYNDRTKIRDGQLSLLAGQQTSFQHEIRFVSSSSESQTWLLVNISLLHDQSSQPAYYFFQVYDLTDRKDAEQKLYHLANYDALTGLINLPQIENEIDRVVEVAQYDNLLVAVVVIDIDDFNRVNDRYGLSVGDELLAELAIRLKDIGHYNQTVGRLGGDRFALILHSLESVNQAMFVASRALDELREPYFIGAEEIQLTACAGITIAPEDGTSAQALISSASEALQIAKSNGINQINFYNKTASVQVKSRISNEIRVVQALENGQLECRLLPLKPVHSEAPQGRIVKLLCYWPDRKQYLEQATFVDIANYTGLPKKLTAWLISQVSQHLRDKIRSGEISNVILPFYPALLRSDDTPKQFREQIADLGLEPSFFTFELSERFLSETSGASFQLMTLSALGFNLCLTHSYGKSASVDNLYRYAPKYYQVDQDERLPFDPRYLKAVLAMAQELDIQIILSNPSSIALQADLLERAQLLLPPLSEVQELASFND